MENACHYERLYKVKGLPTIYKFISEDQDSPLFAEFAEDDNRYWLEDEPKLIRFL